MCQIIQGEEKGMEEREGKEKLRLKDPSFQIANKEASKAEVAKEAGGDPGESVFLQSRR